MRCRCWATRSTPTRPPRRPRRRIRDAAATSPTRRATEVRDFEEYTWLYDESWRDPQVRWLLSTLPSSMIFDDHDLRDDWNTSRLLAPRDAGARRGGRSASSAASRRTGSTSTWATSRPRRWPRTTSTSGCGAPRRRREPLLREFAAAADREADGHKGAQWCFRRDLGGARLLVVDSRCGRMLDRGDRSMVSDAEFAWIAGAARRRLRPPADRHLAAVAARARAARPRVLERGGGRGRAGRPGRRLAERLRRPPTWSTGPAFRGSFDAMVQLVRDVGSGERPPASVLWLSGDVHCSYLARADVEGVDGTAVHQLTMSPFRNPLEPWLRLANRVLERPRVAAALAWLARRAGVVDPPVSWDVEHGPWFGNGLMTLDVDGRTARIAVEHARVVGGVQVLERTHTGALTP